MRKEETCLHTMKSTRAPVAGLILVVGMLLATPLYAQSSQSGPAYAEMEGTVLTVTPTVDFDKARIRVVGPEGYKAEFESDSGPILTVGLIEDRHTSAIGDDGRTGLKAGQALPDGQYAYEARFKLADGKSRTMDGVFYVVNGNAQRYARMNNPGPEGPTAPLKSAASVGTKALDESDDVSVFDDQLDGFTSFSLDEEGSGLGNEGWWGMVNDATVFKLWSGFPGNDGTTSGEMEVSVLQEGSVGIGTAAPSDDLHIFSGSTPAIRLEDDTGEENWQIVSGGSSTLQFDYEGTLGSSNDVMTIAHTGNVGVGTGLDPDKQLHVQGASADTLGANDTMLRVENTSGTEGARRMMELVNNGSPLLVYKDTARGTIWNMSPVGNSFAISLTGTGAQEFQMDGGGNLTIQGALTQNSKRSSKEGFGAVDSDTVLAKLDELSIEEWSYKHTPESRHVSPMAEDFHATFGLGPEDGIAPTDLAGIALAATKALKAENEALKAENEALSAKVGEMDEMKDRLERLENRIAEIAK